MMRKYIRLVLTVASLFLFVLSHAQSKDFEQVYDACVLAQRSMSDAMGSNAEVAHAADLLNSAKWSVLRLYNNDGKGEAKFGKETMVFTPEYLKNFSIDRRLVYRKAKQYAEEQASQQRGDDDAVKLCTRCIDGKSKVTYGMRHYGDALCVAAVAEVNGLINLSVVLVDRHGNRSETYKLTSDEFKGMPSRKLPKITMNEDFYDVYITIENKYGRPRSVAVIVE